jgi:hypothetical protein
MNLTMQSVLQVNFRHEMQSVSVMYKLRLRKLEYESHQSECTACEHREHNAVCVLCEKWAKDEETVQQ